VVEVPSQLKNPGTRLIGKLRDFFVKQYHALLQIRDHPSAIAGGVAIGIFFGFVFVPMKTALAVLTAWAFRASKVAALIAVTAHDILLPLAPILLRWEYDIGFWLLHHRLPQKIKMERHHFRPEQLLDSDFYKNWWQFWWRWFHDNLNMKFFLHVILPMLIGSATIAVPVAAIFYVLTLRIAKRAQAAHLEKEARNA